MRRTSAVLTGMVILSALAFWIATIAIAQPQQGPGGNAGDSKDVDEADEYSAGIDLPQDEKLKGRIKAAQDYIKAEDWGTVAGVLQGLLEGKKGELDKDEFFKAERVGANGKKSPVWISVRSEANRLLGTLPPKGLEAYRALYGAQAAALLKEAKAKSDAWLLARVAQVYLYTEAGGEAADLLGTYKLDRGDYGTAALCYQLLFDRGQIEQLSPLTLFKAIFSFRRSGDRKSKEKEGLARRLLSEKVPNGLPLGDQVVSLDDLNQVIDSYEKSGLSSPNDWPIFRGNPAHNAQARGGSPCPEARWEAPAFRSEETSQNYEEEVRSWLDRGGDSAAKILETRGQAVLPAFFPIALTGYRGDQSLPLVVYRTYGGLTARNLQTGEIEWDNVSNWSHQYLAGPSYLPTIKSWIQQHRQEGRHSIPFENSTLGTISSDNSRVYAIEDLAIPPPSFWQFGNNMPLNNLQRDIAGAIQYNCLMAYNLTTGKLEWQLGGQHQDTEESPNIDKRFDLTDTYFLGPPLPLAGRIYLLNEKEQKLRLIALDPAKLNAKKLTESYASSIAAVKDATIWLQPLVSLRNKITKDVGRRFNAAHLAYGEGVLVCPTNAGAILGVDLLFHRLIWSHQYLDSAQAGNGDMGGGGFGFGRLWRQQQQPQNNGPLTTGWKTAPPIIQDGKVIFTAPDCSYVRCLNLRDGSLIWQQRRERDDLYLAGVFDGLVLIVSKQSCRALNLADGVEKWHLDTGMPSGQGVASENVYYLPLKASAQGKEPEICVIDLKLGEIVGHNKFRQKSTSGDLVVPGNLLFYEGDVISQNLTDVAVFPQLKEKLLQISDRMAKNPTDPIGLFERGGLYLSQREAGKAVEDLRLALASKPPADLVDKIRDTLYAAMTELLHLRFNDGEKYLAEYEAMCKGQESRWANFLCIRARGCEAQGRFADALRDYIEFGSLPTKELVSTVDEPLVKTMPLVWASSRIAAMVARVQPEQREPLEQAVAQNWAEVKAGGDLDKLRHFVTMFGASFAVGREARLQLAESLVKDAANQKQALAEAEKHLLFLSRQRDDVQKAAQATEMLARMMEQAGVLEDAAYYYRSLRDDFGKIVVRDGKTGAQIYDEKSADKRFHPFLPDGLQARGMTGIFKPSIETGNFPTANSFVFEPGDDVSLPFFQRHRLMLDHQQKSFRLQDAATREDRWVCNKIDGAKAQFSQLLQQISGNNNINVDVRGAITPRFPFTTFGHVVILNLGLSVVALDPITKTVLWEKSLVGQGANPRQPQNYAVDPRDNSVQMLYQDGYSQQVGRIGPAHSGCLCLQMREGLEVVDPLTGKTLWTRGGLALHSRIFGDEQHLYLVEYSIDKSLIGTRVFRARDGVTVAAPAFGKLYENCLRILGGRLLIADKKKGNNGDMALRLYDICSGRDVWEVPCPAQSTILTTTDPRWTGFAAPNGEVAILKLETGELIKKLRVEPAHLNKVQYAMLLQDSQQYYVVIHTKDEGNPQGSQINLMPNSGLRSAPVNGYLYAYQKDGEFNWRRQVENLQLILSRFEELPILLFTSRPQNQNQGGNFAGRGRMGRGGGAQRVSAQAIALCSVDKHTGKLLWDSDDERHQLPPSIQMFGGLDVDVRHGRIELTSVNFKFIHTLESGSSKPRGGEAEENSSSPSSKSSTSSEAGS